MKNLFTFILMSLLLTGCATRSSEAWNQRVGNYTYQQALRDLGRPGSERKLSDGSIVAQWLVQQGQPASVGYGMDAQFASPALGVMPVPFQTASSPSHYLRLTFGPDGRLRKWRHYEA